MRNENQVVEKMAEIKREETQKKVIKALKRLKKEAELTKKTISLAKLAKVAGVARQTLYNRPDLTAKLDEINNLIRDNVEPEGPYGTKQIAVQEQRVERLQKELAELKVDFNKLLDQNVALTEQNFKYRKQIADLEERLYASRFEFKVVELEKKR
jgi:lambda repressor-like predicted transcriptional regulator